MGNDNNGSPEEDLQILELAATVHASRKEISPSVDDCLARLGQDPLGDEDTNNRLAQLLSSPRARQGREARERLAARLKAVQPL